MGAQISVYIDSQIESEVSSLLKNIGLPVHQEPLPLTDDSWKKAVNELCLKNSFTIVILRKSFGASLATNPENLSDPLNNGTLRIGVWGSEPIANTIVPMFYIPNISNQDILHCCLKQLTNTLMPGVQSFLPGKAKTFVDRVANDKEIGRKLDQAINFCHQNGFDVGSTTFRARFAVSGILAAAFEEISRSGVKGKVPTLTLGFSNNIFAFSVKWTTSESKVGAWFHPTLLSAGPISSAEASWIHLISESNEVEVVLIFTKNNLGSVDDKIKPPIAVDKLTNARLNASKAYPELGKSEGATVSPFKGLGEPDPIDEKTVVSGASDHQNDEAVKVNGSKEDLTLEKITIGGKSYDLMDEELLKVLSEKNPKIAAALSTNVSNSAVEKIQLQAEVEKLSASIEQYKKKINGLHESLEKTKADALSSINAANQKLQSLSSASTLDPKEAPKNMTEATAKLATAKIEIEKLNGSNETLKKQLTEITKKLDGTMQQERKTRAEQKALEQKLEKAMSTNKEIALQKEVEILKKQIEAARTKETNFLKKQSEDSALIQKLNKELGLKKAS